MTMTNQIYSVPEIKNILLPIFSRYEINKAILFGSYGKHTATENSDVDLLVDSGLHGLKFIGFSEDVRTALDKDIDIFDITHIEPASRIEDEIKNTGVILYEK
ncbi:MAG: nucleotidyltransferase domain-containing protein [Bacillota bacterium]|nr:nucleotidyltransferase domain-containing protein [Bacillota bacterium]